MTKVAKPSWRHKEVLELLLDGLTNAQIGAVLFLSPETVKGRIEDILHYTKLRNRVVLAVTYARWKDCMIDVPYWDKKAR